MLKSDIFKWTLVISIIFHLFIVLGISFVLPNQTTKQAFGPPLKITLVTSLSDQAPEETNTLAQTNSLGDDIDDAELLRLGTFVEKASPSKSATEQKDQIVSSEVATADILNKASQLNSESNQVPLSREEIASNINLAYLNAQSNPREKYVSARSKESKYARYIEIWRQRVERVGNLKYPDEAKQQKLEGSLVLDVAISSNGALNKVRVLDSSGYKTLDDAAERIVQIAAPFVPFPEAFSAEIDTLHIVRTWEFGQGLLKSSRVGNE